MLKKKKPVLDEREMLDMYRVEHFGLWLTYSLLCAAILIQLMIGADLRQMAGEAAVMLLSGVALVIANVRSGVWDADSRPSTQGNALCSLAVGACVCVVLAIAKGKLALALGAGAGAGVICFLALMILMRCMQSRQARQEEELDNE